MINLIETLLFCILLALQLKYSYQKCDLFHLTIPTQKQKPKDSLFSFESESYSSSVFSTVVKFSQHLHYADDTVKYPMGPVKFRENLCNVILVYGPESRNALDASLDVPLGFAETSIFIFVFENKNVLRFLHQSVQAITFYTGKVYFVSVNDINIWTVWWIDWSKHFFYIYLHKAHYPSSAIMFNQMVNKGMISKLNFARRNVVFNGFDRTNCAAHSHFKRKPFNCPADYCFLDLASHVFNFTVNYIDKWGEFHPLLFRHRTRHPQAPLILSGESYLRSYLQETPSSLTFIRGAEDYSLVYCENELKFYVSSYASWLSPFDAVVWISYILCTLTTVALEYFAFTFIFSNEFSIFHLKTRFDILMERIFNMFAIIFKQLERSKLLKRPTAILITEIFLCTTNMFLTMRYESSITSQIIVPPSPVVASSLRELILEKGFKLFFPVNTVADSQGYDLNEFIGALQKSNINTSVRESWMQARDSPGAGLFDCFANKSNKIATDCRNIDLPIVVPEVNAYVRDKNNGSSGIHCHGITREPFFQRIYAYCIRGHGHKLIVKFMHYLRQIGLLDMWSRSYHWARNRNRMAFIAIKNGQDAETVKIHGKVLQIFAIFGFGAGFATLSFFIEKIVHKICSRNDVKQY